MPDLHGNLAGVVNSGETALLAATRYDAFGQTAAAYDSGGTFPTPWRFQGRLDVSPTSDPLYDFSARFYDPATGAFAQLDTYAGSPGDPLSLNRYAYAAANPWTLIDPSGHRFLATFDSGPPPAPTCATAGDNICSSGPDGANPESPHGTEPNREAIELVGEFMEGLATAAVTTAGFAAFCALTGGAGCAVATTVGFALAARTAIDVAEIMQDPTIPNQEKDKIWARIVGTVLGGIGGVRAVGSRFAEVPPPPIRSVLASLERGRTSGYQVETVQQLRAVFDLITATGTRTPSKYPGPVRMLPDGTRVGIRSTSGSGGPTIDIKWPDGSIDKIHLKTWPNSN